MQTFAKIFDIDHLGLELGGKAVSAVGPDGQTIQRVQWTPELTEALCALIRAELPADPAAPVAHRGSAPMWVMGAAMAAMYPHPNHFLPPFDGVCLTLHNLPQGEFDPAAEVEFTVERIGDMLYVTYKADDPNKPQLYGGGHHSYNPELIPLIRAPIAGTDTHVCLRGNSSYNVTMSIATAYFKDCKSLSILGGGPNGPDKGYFCCMSRTPERKIGDMTAAKADV